MLSVSGLVALLCAVAFVAETTERFYQAGKLAAHTNYYWRVDEVTDEGVLTGMVWQFRTH